MSARTRRRRRLTCMCGAVQYPLPVGDRTRTCPLPGPRFENYDLPCTPAPALSIVSQSCDLSRRWRKRPVRVISRAPRRSCALMPVPTTSVRSIGEAPYHAGRGAQVPSRARMRRGLWQLCCHTNAFVLLRRWDRAEYAAYIQKHVDSLPVVLRGGLVVQRIVQKLVRTTTNSNPQPLLVALGTQEVLQVQLDLEQICAGFRLGNVLQGSPTRTHTHAHAHTHTHTHPRLPPARLPP